MASRMTKMPRHPTASVSTPPSTGAATGAMPLMTPMTARTLTSLLAAVTVGGHGTGDDDAAGGPYALKSRMPTNTYTVGEKMQITVEATNSSRETRSSGRRPNLSLSGPNSSLSERETGHARREAHLYHRLRSAEINCHGGSVGRYMSVTSGPKAVRMPSRTIR